MSADEPRHFTPAEAEALVPELDRLLGTAQELLARLEALQQRGERAAHTNGQVLGRGSGAEEKEDDPRALQQQLQGIVDEIQAQGVIVRDIRTGLIDFPARRNEQEIYLCWQRGEALRIEWWHPTDTGIAGRQRL